MNVGQQPKQKKPKEEIPKCPKCGKALIRCTCSHNDLIK